MSSVLVTGSNRGLGLEWCRQYAEAGRGVVFPRPPPRQHPLEVNTRRPLRVTEALLELVARSQRRLVVAISSHMGSIAEIGAPGDTYYRSSKAALNAALTGFSLALRVRE